MKRDVDILIFLEHLNRELDTALLLKILLSGRGYSVQLASVFYDLWESVAALRPNLIVVPWAYSEVRKYCRFSPQPGRGLRILNLHHEQLGVESYMESHMAPRGDAEKAFHLAWGQRFERILRSRGIPEDPVTGSAHCMLTPYWAGKLGKTELRAFQASPRGGELLCRLAGDRVEMEGSCVFYMEGEMLY